MERRAGWQVKRGLPVERWSPSETRRREPAIDGPLRCAFFFPREAQVDNVALMQALSRACRRAGVRLLEETVVTRLHVNGGRVRRVQTSRGVLTAPVVVNCLGSWAGLMRPAPAPIPVEPSRGQMLALRGPKRLFRRVVISDPAYVVQRRDGRLIVGSTVERAGFQKALTVEGLQGILRGLRAMSRTAAACPFLDAWAGLRPRAPDGLPILGQGPIEGLYMATGHFRHGILLAPITATLMAELILRHRSPIDLTPFAPSRFPR